MTSRFSLRARLTVIILVPLLSVAVLAGLWQLGNARRTAADVFDRSLLSAALAVANDVAISDGDALSANTRDILASTSGGRVYYHVYAPDGVIVAGYATPPVGIPRTTPDAPEPTYFEARYLGEDVSGVRVQNLTEIEGFSGVFTTTVWQESAVRSAFVSDLVVRSFIAISSLIAAVALIVWFGVRYGLRPLTDLEDAIARRSGADLSPIKRAVPEEVRGIVATLNQLFGQMSQTMEAQSEFIANAAHQLKNPIAGVMALAESVVSAPSQDKARARAEDLLVAAKHAADLSQKLMMLERADTLAGLRAFDRVDLKAQVPDWAEDARDYLRAGVSLSVSVPATPVVIAGDAVMLREAVSNLIDNANRHGGPGLSRITVDVWAENGHAGVDVRDNGRGIPDEALDRVRQRFVQLNESGSSGLGLALVEAIAAGHDGVLTLAPQPQGVSARLQFNAIAAQAHSA